MAHGDEMFQDVRELVERNIDQARAAYAHYLESVADAMRAWTNSPTMGSQFKDVQELTIRFAKENGQSAFTFGRELAAAKDMPQVVTLQNRYAQEQMQAYARQAQELGKAMAKAAQSFATRQVPPASDP